jgi:hypothetical protein
MAELLLQDLPKGASLLADRKLHARHSAKIKQT